MKTEYKIRHVPRYVVTEYVSTKHAGSSSVVAEVPNREAAKKIVRAFAGKDAAEIACNVVRDNDVSGQLMNIAEDAADVKRGLVVMLNNDGLVRVYGLGKKVGNTDEIFEAGRQEIERLTF
jgi:hypothetical protein